MRKIYWTAALLCLALQAGAKDPVVWHHQGEVSIGGSGGTQASLYIGGDMKFSNRTGSAQKPLFVIKQSRVKLTGNFINDVSRTTGGTLFKPLLGGYFEFCGKSPQVITTSGTGIVDIPSKLTNFIDFPNVEINNNKHVTLDARLAACTGDLELTRGWFILESDKAKSGVDGGLNDVDEDNESVLAHLLVRGNVNYQNRTATDINDRSFIQVNLKLENEAQSPQRSLVGMGSPFNTLYSDYFMFNTLVRPVAAGFLANGTITDSKTAMLAGRGYVAGIDLMGDMAANYGDIQAAYPGIGFDERATQGYEFNRYLFHLKAPRNEMFGDDASLSAYRGEVLNTEDVKDIPLEVGYNYLSNPYTCPLNIDKLLGKDEAASSWKVNSDEWADTDGIWNRVWILNTNSVATYNAATNKIKYTYSYQVALRTGGTYTGTDPLYEEDDRQANITSIAPLQMFVVYSTKIQNITIPKDERVMATTRFLRSVPIVNKRKDDFIVEFRNKHTKTTDRVSFVLREQSELASYSNVSRMAGNPGDNDNTALVYDGIVQNHGSQLYTKDAGGKVLTVQFLALETTHYVQLYHIPPLVEQDLQVLGRRIASKDRVENLWLEDKLYNTTTEITPDMVYNTTSKPDDPVDRFIIRLKTGTSIETETETQHIYAYSQDGSIFVKGFNQEDFGTSISLYDMNGRLLAQKRVDAQSILLFEGAPAGVYMVRISAGISRKVMVY